MGAPDVIKHEEAHWAKPAIQIETDAPAHQ
jgi:hypothetical protein